MSAVAPDLPTALNAHNEYQDLTELRRMIRFLEQDPVLRGLSPADIEALAARVEVRRFRRKQLVWEPGTTATEVYFVRSGVMRVSQFTEDGRELSLALHAKHDLIGLGPAFGESERADTAMAHEDLTLYAIDADSFTDLMQRRPSVARTVAATLFTRHQRMQARMTELVYKAAHARLASLFLELAAEFGVRDSRGIIVNLKLTHREMATLIGTTRETVSFAIVDMRRDRLIENQGKRVVVLDADKLSALATSRESDGR
jgi:CRP/FNR family cyclic AMP-dependent transcriptional regulator